jgi:Flp pilus assembly protein TadD
VHYLLGRLHIQKGENGVALPYLRKAVELGHPDAEAVLNSLSAE